MGKLANLWIKWKVSSFKLKSFNLIWFRYIDNIFFIWTHRENSFKNFMMEFNKFNPNIKFTHEFREASINFLDLNVKLSNGKLQTSWYKRPTDGI